MREDLYPSRQSDEPGVMPRRDPVVYSRWTPEAPLSEALARAYERDGYLVLTDVFDPDELDVLRGEAAQLQSGRGAALKDGMTIREPGSGAVRSVFHVHDHSAVYARMAADARLAEVARFLLGDEVYIHQSRLNYKPGFTGKEFYWHSDFETWHVEDGMPRMRALSMSIQLMDNTPHNGPLLLMQGSHKHYIACVGETPEDHYKKSLRKQEYGVPDDAALTRMAHEGGIVGPTGPAGSVVIFDCNTMHGSNSNITPLPRCNAFFVFNAVSNKVEAPFGPKTPRPEFIAAREKTPTVRPVHGRLTRKAA